MSIKVKTTKKKGGTNALTKYLRKTISPEFMYKFTGKMPPNHPDYKKGGKLTSDELKKFVDAGYKSKTEARNVDDYELDPELSTRRDKVYINKKTGKAVHSISGTDGAKDWSNNLLIPIGMHHHTNRYKNSEAIQKKANQKYGKENVSLVSHSQSGNIADNLAKRGLVGSDNVSLNPAIIGSHNPELQVVRSDSDLVSALTKKGDKDVNISSDGAWYDPRTYLSEHSSNILNRTKQLFGAGITVRKAHKENHFLVRHNGSIISKHKNRLLAEKKALKLSGGVVVKPNAKLEEMIRKNTKTC